MKNRPTIATDDLHFSWCNLQFAICNLRATLRLPPSTRCLLLAIVLFAPSAALAADPSCDVWLVSTRCLPHCGPLDTSVESLSYRRLTCDGAWAEADAAEFHAADDLGVPTVVFIHGNHTDADQAVGKAWYVLERIRSQVGCRPFRYVIWSWPAERMCRRGRIDAQLKMAYSNAESYYLALWLDGLRPGVKVSLVGHSFGPRIILGAMQLLAGGCVAGRALSSETVAAWSGGRRNIVRAVLMAAAEDHDRLDLDGEGCLPLALLDRVLITYNPCDRVLRHYPKLQGRHGPEAMGFVGPSGTDCSDKIEVIDVSGSVGRHHNWRRYSSSPEVCSFWPQYTFLEGEVPAAP